MSDQWFLYKDQRQEGPFSYNEIVGKVETGEITSSDLLWREGMEEWQPAGQIEGFLPRASAPPPSPGQPVPSSGYDTPKKKISGFKLAALIGGSAIVLFIVFIIIVLSVARGALRSSEIHNQAMVALLANPEAVQLLGDPVEAGKAVNGEINVNNGSGNAFLAIPVSGSLRSGELNVAGIRNAGQWSLTTLELTVENGERLNLLTARPDAQSALEVGDGSNENEASLPGDAGGDVAGSTAGMLLFAEPGYGFSMNYPADWSYNLDEVTSTIYFEAPSGSPAEDVDVLVQVLLNKNIGGTYADLNDILVDLEKIYNDLNGEIVERDNGTDYVGDNRYDYVGVGAFYTYEGVEYGEVVMAIQRDSEHFYILIYTVPRDLEDDFSDLVFDQMFDSFRFIPFN